MQILDGKKISNDIKRELAIEVEKILKKGGKKPHLAAILVGDDGASQTYINAKVKACEMVGYDSTLVCLAGNVTESRLLHEIDKINKNIDIDGLIVQLPLPDHIDSLKVTESINPEKDVDGFHPYNVGRMSLNLPTYLPATPAGILELMKRYGISTSSKNCVIIGRSHIVGSPMSILMSRNDKPGNATVTLTHSRTKNLKDITLQADIIIVALGKPLFLTNDMIKDGCCIIDVGITRVESNKTKSGWKLLGDVDFENVKDKCAFITPVPGGVGPMTIAMLLNNTFLASKTKS